MCDSMMMINGKPIGHEGLKDRFMAIRDQVRTLVPDEPNPEIEKGIGYLMMAYATLQRAIVLAGNAVEAENATRLGAH